MLERKAGITQFSDKKVRDPQIVKFMRRVTLYVDDELEGFGYDQVRSRIRITLKNGKIIEDRADIAKGHPLKPMGWEELGKKFLDCALLVLSQKRGDQAIDLVEKLERMKTIQSLIQIVMGKKRNNLPA